MKTAYNSITLRYVHDVVTGEFVNVGVVVFAPELGFLGGRFSSSCERLNAMFHQIDELHYRAVVNHLNERFVVLANEARIAPSAVLTRTLSEIVRQTLPPDDSSLQWSELSGGFTEDPEQTLGQLYERFVGRYASAFGNAART